jgi:hypothetical protein
MPTLDFSPMIILLLLLYGLLLAFSLVVWSALNLRQRSRSGQETEERTAQKPAAVRPAAGVRIRDPEPAAAGQKPWLRPPAERESTAVREGSVHVHPGRPPVTRPVTRDHRPAPAVTPDLREAPAVTQEPPAGGAGQPAETPPAARPRNEDAFERFLRSSRNDPDD